MSITLHQAALIGDPDTIRALLAHHDVDGFDTSERTPLMLAVAKEHVPVVQCLLEHGASPNIQSSFGQTALTTAIRKGSIEIIHLLLQAGSDVNLINRARPIDETPLQIAIFNASLKIVRLLIEAGADLSYRDEQGATPLHFAAEHARTFVVSDMIGLGMDISARDNDGNTPLTVAARRGYTEVVEVLLAAGAQEPTGPNAPKIGALAHAAMNKHKKLFKMLLEARGLPDPVPPYVKSFARDNPTIGALVCSFSGTDLHEAAGDGDADAVHALLAQGRGVNTRNDRGETALMLAARYGHESCARILLNAGSDVSAVSKHGQTALGEAAGKGHAALVPLLLFYDADVHAVNVLGIDAVLSAAFGGHREIVEMLAKAGGRVGLPEAATLGDLDAVHSLLVDGQSIESKNTAGMTALHGAAAGGHLEVVEFLLRRGADIHVRDGRGNTPLLHAAQRGRTCVAERLIEAGADVNISGMFGHTALQTAGHRNNVALMRLLLAHGAHPDGTDDPERETPLFATILLGREEAVRLLLEAGANPNAVYKGGWTILTCAVGIGSPEIVGALLDAGANPDDQKAIRMLRTRHGHDEPEMERIFIERGIDINPRSNREVPKGLPAEIIADISNVKTPEDRVNFLEELRKRVRAKRDEKTGA